MWCERNNIDFSLNKGLSRAELDENEREMGCFPKEFKCWYLMCNGQNFNSFGFFGGYQFYEVDTNNLLLPMNVIKKICHHRDTFESIPFSSDITNGSLYKFYYLRMDSNQVICDGVRGTTFLVAKSFCSFLTHHVSCLEKGMYEIIKNKIQLFPIIDIPTAITNGVKIQVSTVFVYEKSLLDNTHLWTYRIRMSMDKTVPQRYSCILVSRYWKITKSNGDFEEVEGAGVIGLYPKMYPGAYFVYESCCPLPTRSGTMEGYFVMKYEDGTIFNAIVPQFPLIFPPMIE